MLPVGHREHRFQAPQHAIGAPVLGELDCGAHKVALMLVELCFEALEQRERIGRAPGKAGEHLVVVQAAHLARVALHDGVAKRHLAVAAHRDRAVAPDRQDGGAVGIEPQLLCHVLLEIRGRMARPLKLSCAPSGV